MHESGNKMSYHNSVPLQPSRQRLVGAIQEEVHILRQKKAPIPNSNIGGGSLPSLKVVCQPTSCREKDAT